MAGKLAPDTLHVWKAVLGSQMHVQVSMVGLVSSRILLFDVSHFHYFFCVSVFMLLT